jgi:hypothetical protein
MAMADRKPQPPSMKEISSEIKKKVLEFWPKMASGMKLHGKTIKSMVQEKEYKGQVKR